MLAGKLTVNGGANIQPSAPGIDPDNFPIVSPAVRGLLIYFPDSNSNTLGLNGNENALYSGLVYAPNSNITMNGTGSQAYENTQIIGWNVEVGGNASTSVTYNGCNSFTRPTYIELSK